MASALESRSQKYVDAIQGRGIADQSGPQSQNVCVVVLARQARRSHVMADSCANQGVAVCRNRDTDPRSTDQNAAVSLAGDKCIDH